MGEVTFETVAYAKIILHAAKYPHCAVNGILLADAAKTNDGPKVQNLNIVDTVPLFHHSHYVSPMAEIALTQIEIVAGEQGHVIAGYYAAGERLYDNDVATVVGQRIADKIAENFPQAIFIVVDNARLTRHLKVPALKLHRHADSKWKPTQQTLALVGEEEALQTVSLLVTRRVHTDLVDWDNYLDDVGNDWTNAHIRTLLTHLHSARADKDTD